jgi:hypothetical protein
MIETRILTKEDLKFLSKLRHSPIIVQEKIERGLDIRVNIFGEKVFAASVNNLIQAAELDWRLDITAKWNEYTLPEKVKKIYFY